MESWDTVGGIQALGCPQGLPQTGFGVALDGRVLGGFGVENHPKNKFSNVFGDTFGGVFTMFLDGFDAF